MSWKHKNAQGAPPGAGGQKRLFIPSTHTQFNDIKRRKLLTGVEPIRPCQHPGFDSETLELMKIEKEKNELERQKILNYATYERAVPKTNFTRKKQLLSTEELQLQEIQNRPKFKARPVPRSHKSPNMLTKNSSKHPTIPQGFNFSTSTPNRHLAEDSPIPKCQKSFETPPFKARSVPDFSNPFTPTKSTSSTKVKEFKLHTEQRGATKHELFQEQIQNEIRSLNELRNFKAAPAPAFTPPTKLSTFSPSSEKGSQNSSQSSFKAKPMPDFSKPFIPTLDREPISVMDIELNTDRRAEERQLFEEKLREKDRIQQQLREAEALKQVQLEQQQMEQIRKSMEFKARPMPSYNYFHCFKSNEELTVPQSPMLQTQLRFGENKDPNIRSFYSDQSTHPTNESYMNIEDEDTEMAL